MLTLQKDRFIRNRLNQYFNYSNRKSLILNKNNLLNLYYIFIDIQDLKSNNWIKKTFYIKTKNKYIINYLKKLPNNYKFNFYLNLRKSLSLYLNKTKTIRPAELNRWIKNNSYPAPFIRILSHIYSKEKDVGEYFILEKVYENLEYLEDINQQTKFKPTKFFSDLFTDFNFYLVGCTLGDGHLTKNVWRLADGNPNIKLLDYSFKYLTNINNILKKYFYIDGNIRKDKISNMYELIIPNKLFSQFIHYFFEVPFGKKYKFKLPSIIKYVNKGRKAELEMKFLRGIFDSEGYINNSIAITVADKIFIKDCNKLLNKIGIICNYKKVKSGYNIQINKTYLPSFAKTIGFFHPLKQKKIISCLKKGITKSIFIGLKKENLIQNTYFDLSKINELRIDGLSKWIKKLRKKLTQKEIGKISGVDDWCVRYWENGTGIKLKHLLNILNFLKLDFNYLYKLLNNKNIQFYIGGIKVSKKIKLPLRLNNNILTIAKYVRPLTTLTIRKEDESKRLNKLDISKIENLIKNTFKVEIKYNQLNKGKFIENKVITKFFETFFIYKNPWEPYSKTKIRELKNIWNF